MQKMLEMQKMLLDATEAGRVIGCGPDQARRLARDGQIPSVRHGRRGVRFPLPAIEAFIQARSQEALANVRQDGAGGSAASDTPGTLASVAVSGKTEGGEPCR